MILLLSYGILGQVLGQSLRAPAVRVDELNTQEPLAPVVRCQDAPSTTGASLQQCMADLCGPADFENTVYLTDENIDRGTDRSVLEEFVTLEEDLRSTGEYFQEVNGLVIEEFQRRLNNKNSNIHNLANDPRSASIYAQMIFENLLMADVDYSKPIDERLSVVTLPHFQGDDFEGALKDFAEQHRKAVNEGPWYNKIFQGIYTPEEGLLQVSERLPALKARYEDEFGEGFLPYDIAQDFEYLEDRIQGTMGSAYPEDAQRVTSIFMGLDINLRQQRGEQIESPRPSCSSGKCFEFAQSELRRVDVPKLIEDFQEKNRSFDIEPAKRNCETFILSKTFGRQNSVDEFKRKLPQVLDNYKRKVLSSFSEETREFINGQIDDNVKFVFPNIEEQRYDISTELMDSFFRAESGLPPLDALNQLPTTALIRWVNLSRRPDGEFDPFFPLENLCAPGPYPTANDAFIPVTAFSENHFTAPLSADRSRNNIFVSPFSCEHTNHGEDIVSHELSHFVSYLFTEDGVSSESKEDFNKIRQCSIRMYQDSVYSSGEVQIIYSHEGDLRTTEEDTADFLAFMAYPEIGPGKEPFTCAMLEPLTEGGYRLDDMSSARGPHSMVYFRILNEAIQKNVPLSESCNRFLNQVDPEFRRVKCGQ